MKVLKILFITMMLLGLLGLYFGIFVYDLVSLPAVYICGTVVFLGLWGNCGVALYGALGRKKEVEK